MPSQNTDNVPLNKKERSPVLGSVLICLILTILTLTVYIQAKDFEFINLDDPLYVTENAHVRQGLTKKSIPAAFTTITGDFWIPITVLSLMADYELYGMSAGGFHLTNIFLHLLNAILLFFVLKTITDSFYRSAFAACLFAVHPLFTESVMWISERKDVLSMFFFLLTLLSYSRYVLKKSRAGYIYVLLFFILGLMAKPMLVTLPCVLLLLDYWPLNRLTPSGKNFIHTLKPLVIEKIPLFILSLLFSIITFMTQNRGQAVVGLNEYSVMIRIKNAVLSYGLYLKKFIIPADLAVFYPHPLDTIPVWQITLSAAVLIIISFFAFRTAKKYPFFMVGWLWFLGILFPVIGLTQSGLQAMADRFIYIPSIGLIIIVTWGTSAAVKDLKNRKKILCFAVLSSLLVLSIVTRIQAGYWKNSIFLFKHAVETTKNNYIAHTCLANGLAEKGLSAPALEHYAEALRIKPNYAKAHYNLGLLLAKENLRNEAVKHFRLSLQVRPNRAKTHNALAIELAKTGRIDEALLHFREALRIDPGFIDARNNLGLALLLKGETLNAVRVFQDILKKHPDHAFARNNLKKALEKSKK